MGPKTQSVLIERFALDFSAIILLTQAVVMGSIGNQLRIWFSFKFLYTCTGASYSIEFD